MVRVLSAIGALVCAALLLPTFANADDNACNLFVNTSFLGRMLGGDEIEVLRDITGKSSADNTEGDLHSVCNGVVWSGAKPKTRRAALGALQSGRGSAFAVATWEPDEESPYAAKWTGKPFSLLINTSILGSVVLPGLPPFAPYRIHKFTPKKFARKGLGANGVLGTPFVGVAAGEALWWSPAEHEIVSVSIGTTPRRPLVKELNELGAIVLGGFGMLTGP